MSAIDEVIDAYLPYKNTLQGFRRHVKRPPERMALYTLVDQLLITSERQNWNEGEHESLPAPGDLKKTVGLPESKSVEAGLQQRLNNLSAARFKRKWSGSGGRRPRTEVNYIDFTDQFKRGREVLELRAAQYAKKAQQRDRRQRFQERFISKPRSERLTLATGLTFGLSATENGRRFLAELVESHTRRTPTEAIFNPLTVIQENDPPGIFESDGSLNVSNARQWRKLILLASNVAPGLGLVSTTKEGVADDAVAFIVAVTRLFASPSEVRYASADSADGDVYSYTLAHPSASNVLDLTRKFADFVNDSLGIRLNSIRSDTGRDLTRRSIAGELLGGLKTLASSLELLAKTVAAVKDPSHKNWASVAAAAATAVKDLLVQGSRFLANSRWLAGRAGATAARTRVAVARLGSSAGKRILGYLLAPIQLLDAYVQFVNADEMLERGEYTAAAGHFALAGTAILSVALIPVGGWIAAAVLFAFTLVATILTLDRDHPIERWLENGYFGTNWNGRRDPDKYEEFGSDTLSSSSDALFFKWVDENGVNFVRQISEFHSMGLNVIDAVLSDGNITSLNHKEQYPVPTTFTDAAEPVWLGLRLRNMPAVDTSARVQLIPFGKKGSEWKRLEAVHVLPRMGTRSMDYLEDTDREWGHGTGRHLRVSYVDVDGGRFSHGFTSDRDTTPGGTGQIQTWNLLITSTTLSDLLGLSQSRISRYERIGVEVQIVPQSQRLEMSRNQDVGPQIYRTRAVINDERDDKRDNYTGSLGDWYGPVGTNNSNVLHL